MVNLAVNLAGIEMKNPVMVASGTFDSGREYADLIDLNRLGALVTKSLTLHPKAGNPPPRICETTGGMLNSIGLQNKGVTSFIQNDLSFLNQYKVPVIVSIAGESINEYLLIVERLEEARGIAGLELNLSCPNVKKGGMFFGLDAHLVYELTKQVREITRYPLIVKLTPNVTDIRKIALAAQRAGADAVSLVNTFLGLAIDINTFKPKLGSGFGGLSGPAIKPLALRMVYEVSSVLDCPVVGMGGIMTAQDAIEFILAGASAVAVGTANFINPRASLEIIQDLEKFLSERGFNDIKEIIGKVEIR